MKTGEIFARIDELSKEERLQGEVSPYSGTLSLSNVNKKIKGTDVVGIDTFRGCHHDCLDCYANKMSKISRKDFSHAVPVTNFTGRVLPEKTYRFGTSGDPDHDWEHTSFIAKTMVDLGMKSYFFITKLQSIEGIDPKYVRNIQVSLDPLNEKHFHKTVNNIERLLASPDRDAFNIYIRLRTVKTKNMDIWRLMKAGILFAEMHELPILETKMKFSKKRYIDELSLVGYTRKHGTYQFEGSALSVFTETKAIRCDEKGTGSCVGCNTCAAHGSL